MRISDEFRRVLFRSAQDAGIVDELDGNDGTLSAKTRFALSVAAFNRVAQYDACISDYLSSIGDDGTRNMFPGQANGSFIKVADLRYGENPQIGRAHV